ncbi:ParB/RepB/Spo0J family partition protein [Nocardioides panzhihuensis]|uniref:ParB/RepB/Spo0J family partition protein n=1 Tax=Nocardioides panzhihuensis TaxID=860243 RepID=UPI0015C797BC|nr:ParB/RepB/Spo0J family partition protein [Nocardioides panzhihuensis]
MSKQPPKRGLGRGLGSLIPTAPASGGNESSDGAPVQSDVRHSDLSAGATSGASVDPRSAESTEGRQIEKSDLAPVDGAYFAELPVTQIHPNHVQPRQVFDEDAMAELVHSINEIGLLQPIVVRKVATDSYELVMGERRWRATQQAGLEVIPAIVRETDDTDMLRDALLENLHRSQLNPLEEAAAYQQLLNDFECTHDELAQRIGRSRPQISNTIRLLKLSPSVQRRVAAGVLSAGHARALLAVDGEPQQDKLAQKVVAEGISVRGLEEIVALGDPDGDAFATPRVKRAKPSAPGLKEISDRLSDRFDTRVKVDLGRSKGKITVEFATLDDLRRIVELMSPASDESI